MTLPATIPCDFCKIQVPIVNVTYRGVRQDDPSKDGFHAYLLSATCPQCGTHLIVHHGEPTKL